MNVMNIEQVSKTYGDRRILQQVSYGIHDGDKIGVIGMNGTGKTTLLKMIAGLEEPDEGRITRQNGLRIGYLPQNPVFPEELPVLSYVAAGGAEEEWNARNVLNRLGIRRHDERIGHLSGGQKKRIALARALVNPADVLILDEPTNHIDHEMAAWLEDYLQKFCGVLIIVTHDRYFLDRVTNQILEISHGKLYGYTANYSQFLELKAQREAMELASERKRQSLLRMELEWASRGARARSTKQRARLDRLEELRQRAQPEAEPGVQMDSVESRMGKKTIELRHVSKGFGGKTLIQDFNYIVLRGQRLGIIGPNGCGKTTLMKLLAGAVEPDAGQIDQGETIRVGYFAQEEEIMDPDQRVIDYIRAVAEYIPTSEGSVSAAQLLERFLFDGTMQYTPVGRLSGGERRRLYLLKVLAMGANVLLLDEPTNDLDIPTLTILEDFLDSFNGIVIAVSHDRYFLDRIADRIFAFEDGQIRQYEGGYTDYLKARRPQESPDQGKTADKKASQQSWKEGRKQKLKFTFNEEREYAIIEDEISALEQRVQELEQEMEAHAAEYLRLTELTEEKEAVQAALEEKLERWMALSDLAERIQSQDEES